MGTSVAVSLVHTKRLLPAISHEVLRNLPSNDSTIPHDSQVCGLRGLWMEAGLDEAAG